MVSAVNDNIEELAALLSAEDVDIAAQGWEILGCLDASVRGRLADHLLTRRAWRLATRCLFPEPLAQMRLARFRVRCVQLRLLRLREQGIEPDEWAWQLTEEAELHAAGRLPQRRYQRLLQDTEYLREPWYNELPFEELGDLDVDLEMIPDDWPARCDQPGVSLDIGAMLLAPAEEGFVDYVEALDRRSAAEHAVAYILLERAVDAWGDDIETIPEPESMEEWALQRQLWESIMLRSGDGTEVLYHRQPSRSPRRRPVRPASRDWSQLSWG